MHRAWWVIFVVGCYRSTAPSPPVEAPAPSVFVYGGHDGLDAELVDLAVTPDGRVAVLACTANRLTAVRWDATGQRAVEKRLGTSCASARMFLAGDDDVIVIDSECADPDGCMRVRRFDPQLAGVRWTFMPRLVAVFAAAIDARDRVAIAGRPTYGYESAKTDVVVIGADGAKLRSHELLAKRLELAAIEHVDDDLLVAGVVHHDPTTPFVVDGTPHASLYGGVFAMRLGATPWLTELDDLAVVHHKQPALIVPDRRHAVLVATARTRDLDSGAEGETEHAQRIDLATGRLGESARGSIATTPEYLFGPFLGRAVLAGDRIAVAKPLESRPRMRAERCAAHEICEYTNGPEAYGAVSIPQVHVFDPIALRVGDARTQLRGYAHVASAKLAYATRQRALFLGGTVTGTLELGARTITTDEVRRGACAFGSTHTSRVLLATVPPSNPCVGDRVTYTSAVFVTRVP